MTRVYALAYADMKQARGRAPPVEPGARRVAARPANSSQACLRRPERAAERCFLPDLTRFTGLRRAGPGSQRPLA